MYNISLFSTILNKDAIIINQYLKLIDNNIVKQPIIFCDKTLVSVPSYIPVFNTSYIKHNFIKQYILTSENDYQYLTTMSKNLSKVFVLSTDKKQQQENIIYFTDNDDIVSLIKDNV